MKHFTILLMLFCMPLIQLSAQNKNLEKENQQKKEEQSSISLENLIKQKSNSYVITKEHVSSISGVHHVYLRQDIDGLEVCGTESSVHLDKTGKLLTEHNKFLADIQATLKNSSQSLSARAAIISVANQMGYKISDLQEIKSIGGINKAALFNKAGISSEDIPAKLMYYYKEGVGTQLVWELSIAELKSNDWWNFLVDANSGKILYKSNWTNECNIENGHSHEVEESNFNTNLFDIPDYGENPANNTNLNEADGIGSYNVFPMPIESPYYGSRSLVVNPANNTASPFGWHDTNGAIGAEYTITRGNNVHAFNQSNTYSPDAGADLIFDYNLDFTLDPTNADNLDASITNLFYWNNIIHDVIYQYGFDEAAGNFQENNYGNPGIGTDYVNARAHYGILCNAFFGTPPDGGKGSMEMYLCDNATPNKDGDFDHLVIAHEYGHGISTRLTGGAANSECLNNSEQMGEGWSDFYGYMLTMNSNDTGTTARGVGTYLFDQGIGGSGIRNFMYSTDMAVNPHTYDDIKTTGSSEHALGEIWATMLWDLTWELIDAHGFDSNIYNYSGNVAQDKGNIMAMAIVTEGLKLQPCSPGFVDGRDAILAADAAIYGGANECIIWASFARRGLGLSADQGSTGNRTDGTEAFDVPNPPVAVCVAPFSIMVDSNGDAVITGADLDGGSTVPCGLDTLTASPDTFTCADVGDHLVTLTVTDIFGFESSCTTTVTVEKRSTTLTYTGDLEGQCTDPIDLSATLVDVEGIPLSGRTITFTLGTQSTTADTDLSGVASTTMILSQEPGNYTVRAEFMEEACYLGSFDEPAFEILGEDVIVEYTGHTVQATPNENTSVTTVVLTANIQEVFDGYPGDIRNAEIKFVNRDDGTDISGWIPVTDLFDPSDPSIGTVSYDWLVNIGNLSSQTFTVGIIVRGCYTRDNSDDNTIVTVYIPVGDFITGGGFINPDNSAGTYASTPGLKTNFGFNVKFNKSGRKLKGNINIIFRIAQVDGIHTYQIKGNAIQSLGVDIADPNNLLAEFATKANLKDITDPLNPINLGGNHILRVDMTDRGEPGIDDSIGINLSASNGILLYSSNWSGIATEEMVLSGGNLVVHSGFSSARILGTDDLALNGISLYPNPAKEQVVIVNSQNIQLEEAAIYDLMGRLVNRIDLRGMGVTKTVNVSELAIATYVIIIKGKDGQIVKRLLKE